MTDSSAGSSVDAATIRDKHKEFLFPAVVNYYSESVVLDHGEEAGRKRSSGPLC